MCGLRVDDMRIGAPHNDRLPWGVLVAAGGGVAFLVLPIVALVVRAPWSSLVERLGSEAVLDPLRLSLVTTTLATALALALGLPLALVLSRLSGWRVAVLRAAVAVPVVLPPVVSGVALLLLFGRRGLVGPALEAWFGVSVPFTTSAVVLAQCFVGMPLLVLTAETALRGVDPSVEEVAASLGSGRWRRRARVTIPAAAPGIAVGAVICWARALGEFGATLTVAGSLPQRTETLPLAVYQSLEVSVADALVLSLVLLVVAILAVAATFSIRRRR
jgi:molybdate transport system permease protein